MLSQIFITATLVATARAGIATSYVSGNNLGLRGLGELGIGRLRDERMGGGIERRGSVDDWRKIGIGNLGGIGIGGELGGISEQREIRLGKLGGEGELRRIGNVEIGSGIGRLGDIGELGGLRGKLGGEDEVTRIGIGNLGGIGIGGKLRGISEQREIRLGKLGGEGELRRIGNVEIGSGIGRLGSIGELGGLRIGGRRGKLGGEDEVTRMRIGNLGNLGELRGIGNDRIGGIEIGIDRPRVLGGIGKLGAERGLGEIQGGIGGTGTIGIGRLGSLEEIGGIGNIGLGRIDSGLLTGKRDRVVDLWAPPRYEFKYGVEDPKTGDRKQQTEVRDGDVVKGEYSLAEPDGTIRVVKYTADDHNGFNAVVSRIGKAVHPTVLLTKGIGLGRGI